MHVRFGKRRRIQFTDHVHPKAGIASVVIGMVSLIMLIALFVISMRAGGRAGVLVGILGMMVLAASVTGFVLAVKCYARDDIYRITPAAGSVINGILVVIGMLLYVSGAV